MKFGTTRQTAHEVTAAKMVPHQHVDALAFDVHDPVTRLIHTIGVMFNEPRYYSSDDNAKDKAGLTEQAREVIATAEAVATGATPEDLLIIAAWARDTVNGLKLRSTPQVMLAIAAARVPTKPFVTLYGPKIMLRADEIRQVFGIYRRLFMTAAPEQSNTNRPHHGSLPHCLRKALAAALAAQSDYSLLKYDGTDRPTFGDVLKMVKGRTSKAACGGKTEWPLSKAMYEYLVNRKYLDGAPEILAARQEFLAVTKDQVTLELIKKAGLTWENVLSHLGSSKETWELCIPIMGEMALTRNLRNFEQASISDLSWDMVYQKLLAVEESVQLPFRYFSAYKETTGTAAKTVMGQMLDKSVEKIRGLPGVSVVVTDNSGSMDSSVSEKSSVTMKDAGNMLGAILAKKGGRKALIFTFGDYAENVEFNQADSTLRIKEQVDEVGRKTGCGTSIESLCQILDQSRMRGLHVDRFIIFSDMCCYSTRGYGIKGRPAGLQASLNLYRQNVNPKAVLYSINMAGYKQAQVDEKSDGVFLLSGWSDRMLDMMYDLEQGVNPAEGAAPIPTIELLRQNYRLTRQNG